MNTITAVGDSGAAEPTVGGRLAAARAAHNLSLADVARQLKMSVWQIEALEADRYQRLPSAVFVRGFIRNYARLVGLDPVSLLAEVEVHLPHNTRPTPELPPSADIPFPSGTPVKWRRYAAVVTVLAGAAITFELYQGDAPEVTVQPRSSTVPRPAAALPPAVAPAPTAADFAKASKPKLSAPPLPDAVAAAAAAAAEPEAGAYQLAFVFERESWVEVRDGHGRRLLWQLNPAGSRQTVNGVPPLSLVIGNANGVHLELNHQPVDLAPHTDIDVARLTLE